MRWVFSLPQFFWFSPSDWPLRSPVIVVINNWNTRCHASHMTIYSTLRTFSTCHFIKYSLFSSSHWLQSWSVSQLSQTWFTPSVNQSLIPLFLFPSLLNFLHYHSKKIVRSTANFSYIRYCTVLPPLFLSLESLQLQLHLLVQYDTCKDNCDFTNL